MRMVVLGILLVALAGCSGGGPASTDTVSSSLPTLESKVDFLQRYVLFRRGYQELDFHIRYRDGSSGVPAPSEWDIRLVARVPAAELDSWALTGVQAVAAADTRWLTSVPNAQQAAGIAEWYVEPRRVVGINRAQGVVAYRSWAD